MQVMPVPSLCLLSHSVHAYSTVPRDEECWFDEFLPASQRPRCSVELTPPPSASRELICCCGITLFQKQLGEEKVYLIFQVVVRH